MFELNKIMLVGRLTRDPEYRSTSTGRAVAKFSLAVNRRKMNRDSGESQDETTFVDVDVWEKQAEFVKNYLRKGSGVYVEGRLKQENWQDKESGGNRSKLSVTAERVMFAESKAEAERHGGGGSPSGGGGGYSGGGAPAAARPAPAQTRDDSGGGGYDDGGGTNDDLPF